MNYHPDDFLSLIEEAENQGGVHLSDETHRPNAFRLNYPIDEDNPTGPKASRKFQTTGCHRRANFLVPLLDEECFLDEDELTGPLFDFRDDKHPKAVMSDGTTPALAKVCAVDDAMGLWPRFQGVLHTGESFEPYQ